MALQASVTAAFFLFFSFELTATVRVQGCAAPYAAGDAPLRRTPPRCVRLQLALRASHGSIAGRPVSQAFDEQRDATQSNGTIGCAAPTKRR